MKIIIPARGGSKRIPKKNLLDLNGKSLLYYSIKTSLNITDDVYVSTEDKEIKKFSKQYFILYCFMMLIRKNEKSILIQDLITTIQRKLVYIILWEILVTFY